MPQEPLMNTLTLARGGDQSAFAALLSQYTPLIEHQLATIRTRRPDILAEDEKDLRQEAYLAFYRALMSFDLSQGEVSFGLYAKICIENGLISALRKMRPSAESLDTERMAELPADGEGDPTRRLREQEDYEALCRRIALLLSPFENDIWQRYVAGRTAAEIAAELGRDHRSIHNAIYRIRHKLRGAEDLKKK